MFLQCVPKNVPFFIFGITQSKISRFKQFLVYRILRKFATAINLPTSPEKYRCTTLWNSGLLLLSACYRNMTRTCFNEEVKTSNKNLKVNGSAVCFLYNIFFLCYFYNRSLYCFNLLFSSRKSGWLWKEPVVGWLWKEPVVEWCGKW